MSRNFILSVVAVAMTMAGGGVLTAQAKEADACQKECIECQSSCLACASECLDELAAGKADRKNCIKLCLDCADICGACAKIAARGALFAKHNDAATEAQNILKANFKGVEPQRFVVPLYVEVLNHSGPVPVADVAEYLSRGSRLYLNTTENGNGPGDSLVLPRIDWSRIRSIKEFPHE